MKLSIITINWNNREGLRMTLDNVLSQSARDQFEYIVVDGGAPDGSGEMLASEYDGKIDKWVSEPVKPIYQKMNMGVRMATGDYLLFLNSGDNLHGTDAIKDVIDESIMLETGKKMAAHTPITLLSLYNHSIPHNAAFIRRELLIKHPYDENLRIVSDWKFFVEALIMDNCSYRTIDAVIAEFDCNELFPERVMTDYFRFTKGGGYQDKPYDKFYVKLRRYRSGKLLYALNVRIMHLIALFKKSARWSREFSAKSFK